MTVVSFPDGRMRQSIRDCHKSGLELIPRRRRRGKLASEDDFTKATFSPWTRDRYLESSLHPKHFEHIGIVARLAYALMLKTREELIEDHKAAAETDMFEEITFSLADTSEKLKSLARMIEGAEVRFMASACAAAKEIKAADDDLASKGRAS